MNRRTREFISLGLRCLTSDVYSKYGIPVEKLGKIRILFTDSSSERDVISSSSIMYVRQDLTRLNIPYAMTRLKLNHPDFMPDQWYIYGIHMDDASIEIAMHIDDSAPSIVGYGKNELIKEKSEKLCMDLYEREKAKYA